MTNITELKTPADPAKANLEKLRRDLPTILASLAIVAQVHKAAYDAHIKAGFTPEQALVLCKT